MTHDPQTQPDPQADFWASLKADYLSGTTAAVLAERYGVSVRTVRRRASDEGWRRSDRPFNFKSPETDRGAALERYPKLRELEVEDAGDTLDLLFQPTVQTLRCFAFRRAAEAAANSRPYESTAWMRLVNSMNVSGDRIDAEMRPFREAHYFRAEAMAASERYDADPGEHDSDA